MDLEAARRRARAARHAQLAQRLDVLAGDRGHLAAAVAERQAQDGAAVAAVPQLRGAHEQDLIQILILVRSRTTMVETVGAGADGIG